MEGGGDRRDVCEKLEGFCWGVVKGSGDLNEGLVLDLLQLFNEFLFGVLGVSRPCLLFAPNSTSY